MRGALAVLDRASETFRRSGFLYDLLSRLCRCLARNRSSVSSLRLSLSLYHAARKVIAHNTCHVTLRIIYGDTRKDSGNRTLVKYTTNTNANDRRVNHQLEWVKVRENMTSKNIIRAAVVQTCTARYSLADTLDKLEYYARVAAKEGAQLAVFPEAL